MGAVFSFGARRLVCFGAQPANTVYALAQIKYPTVEKKLDILTFLPPSETGDSHHRYIRLWECPPPPLALPAQDSVPR